ncbi:Cullin-3A [Camellia lanceoleosa]|nr:Cullin-3A [Camellia lanceoleosa]
MSAQKKRNFQIESFKHRVVVDPKYAEKTWKILEHAIHEICNHNASDLSFEELYRNAYNMVLHKFGEKLYSGLVSTMTSHLKEIARSIEAAQGGLFLEELNRKWADHNKALQMIRDILMFHELGLNLWRDNIIHSSKIQLRLQDTLLELVGLMRNVIKMLMDLGSSVYQEDFEKPFLECCDCGDYLKKAERHLNEEIEQVSHYLDVKSEAKITNVVEKEMIEIHMYRLIHLENSGLVNVIVDDKMRAWEGCTIYVMTSHIRDTGKQLVTDPERLKDPVDFLQRLLDVKDKHDRIIRLAFSNDKTVQNALNSSFEYFINLNPRSPELIRGQLLSGKTVSDDAERSLIVKLKTECGYQFTSKLTDMKTSQDTMQGFHASMGAEIGDYPTLTVQVLTTGSWPTQSSATCNLPSEILGICEKFWTYYLGSHTGRRLSWQTNMGSADLKATFGKGQKHELNVSTYQMCILMQQKHLPDLKRSLQSLACVKGKNVLRKEPMSKEFTSKLYKVKIGTVVAQKESEPEKQETRQRVEEDRKPQIEVAIVRIMKSRRVLDHNNIVAEVTKQLQTRFLPNPVVIKKRIESLIERVFGKGQSGLEVVPLPCLKNLLCDCLILLWLNMALAGGILC